MEYVSFVILHYKDYSVTDTCVRSILAMEQQERIRIVIVDNGIRKKKTDRNCSKNIRGIQNQGFADKKMAAFLMQIIKGISTPENILGKSYIIVLNNDIEFTQKDFISRLEKVM